VIDPKHIHKGCFCRRELTNAEQNELVKIGNLAGILTEKDEGFITILTKEDSDIEAANNWINKFLSDNP
jgi:hypothetical protein